MTRWMPGAAAAGALALAFFVGRPLLLAEEHEEGGHERGGQGHGEPAGEAGGTEPGTYAEAMAAIAAHQAAVGAHIDRRELADLHKAAEPIRDIAKTLAALALKEASGIPPEQVREVNLLSKDLAATWDKIDAAGDAGDLEASKAVYAEMSALVAKLQAFGKGAAPGPAGEAIRLDLATEPKEPKAGEPATLVLTPRRVKDGSPVRELEIVHEKAMHLFIVSSDLAFFAHEHPEPAADGSLKLSFTFPAGGLYRLFYEFTPKGGAEERGTETLPVAGGGTPGPALAEDAGEPKRLDGYEVALSVEPSPPAAAAPATLSFTVRRDGGDVVDLEPYLGAPGHCVILREDGTGYAHVHPEGGLGLPGEGSPGGPTVAFRALLPAAGLHKAWFQFRHKGEVHTAAFVFRAIEAGGPVHEHGHDHDHGHVPGPGHEHLHEPEAPHEHDHGHEPEPPHEGGHEGGEGGHHH